MRIYACHGNDPKPASSPPTIRRWAVCFAIDIPQPVVRKENYRNNNMIYGLRLQFGTRGLVVQL